MSDDVALCSVCGEQPRLCRNAYRRAYGPRYCDLSPEARRRANARATAKVYLRRGKLARQPCSCGSVKVEMHHDDYAKPLEVRWLCRPCHLAHHGKQAHA